MRNQSKKRRAMRNLVNLAEQQFRDEFPLCWECGGAYVLDIHHIARGGVRQTALRHRSTWMIACRQCHDAWHANRDGPKGIRGIARELAIKLLHDPRYFNRREVLSIMGRAPTAITMGEIAVWLKLHDPDDNSGLASMATNMLLAPPSIETMQKEELAQLVDYLEVRPCTLK